MIASTTVDISGLETLGVTARDVVGSATIAATRSARAAMSAIDEELERRIDRPTRFTLNSDRLEAARIGQPNPVATVQLRDDLGARRHYLLNLEEGTRRRATGLERALRRAGRLGDEEYLAAGDEGTGVPLNQFGNVPTRFIGVILSDLRAQQDANSNSTRETRARRRLRRGGRSIRGTFFIVRSRFYQPDAGLPPGIYQKQPDGELDKFFDVVVGAPNYADQLDTRERAREAAREAYLPEFRQAFAEGIGRRVASRFGLTTRRPTRRR